MRSNIPLSLAFLSATTLATIHQITVGPDYVYSPDTITDAASGDIISFTFGQGHNVVSGSFDNPCQPSGNIYSGDPGNGEVFSVTLNSTDPLWIYCSVPGHCQGGMAMVVNPPSDQTLDQYKSAAASVRSSSEPDSIGGGVFGAVSEESSAATSSGAASSSSVAMSASASSAISSVSASASSAASSVSAAASSAASSASGNNAVATGAPAVILAAAGLLALL